MSLSCCFGGVQQSEGVGVYDVAIIGGGISGAYMAYKLKKHNSKLKVCIFEKTHRIGGRLLSGGSDNSKERSKDELGGMRVFPSEQRQVAKMIMDAGCALIKIGSKDQDNLFYTDGSSVKKKDVVLDKSKGRSPEALISDVLAQFHKEFDGKNPLAVEEIRDMNMHEVLKKYGATDTEIKQYVLYTGYDVFSDENIAASVFLNACKLDTSSDQKYVHEGYEKVVARLAKRSKAEIRYSCTVHKAERVEDSDLQKLITSRGDFHAKNIVFAIPVPALQEVAAKSSSFTPERVNLFDSVVSIPLFKVFLEWEVQGKDKPWWQQQGFTVGKSTTDTDFRQIHYYNDHELLIYSSGDFADKLNEKFLKDERAAEKEAHALLKLLHNDDNIPAPDYDQTIYKFWKDGSHKWKKGIDIHAAMETVLVGSDKNSEDSNVYICGDAFSTHQGWVMGCLETADMCLTAMIQRKRI